jgi:hypothetical protein
LGAFAIKAGADQSVGERSLEFFAHPQQFPSREADIFPQ